MRICVRGVPLASSSWTLPASGELLISGDWEGAPPLYREKAGEPAMVTARVLAKRIGAELLEVPGYYPHVQQAERVNTALRELWG